MFITRCILLPSCGVRLDREGNPSRRHSACRCPSLPGSPGGDRRQRPCLQTSGRALQSVTLERPPGNRDASVSCPVLREHTFLPKKSFLLGLSNLRLVQSGCWTKMSGTLLLRVLQVWASSSSLTTLAGIPFWFLSPSQLRCRQMTAEPASPASQDRWSEFNQRKEGSFASSHIRWKGWALCLTSCKSENPTVHVKRISTL